MKKEILNVFAEQEKWMNSANQTTHIENQKQFEMYNTAIKEEVKELQDAIDANDKTEILDAIIDIIVVAIGAGHSMGFNLEKAFQEVMRTNWNKLQYDKNGKLKLRADGKILKPDGWQAPNFEMCMNKFFE